MHKIRRPVRKLKLYAEALEDVSQKGGSSIAQVVEERYVEAAKQVLDLSRELKKSMFYLGFWVSNIDYV
jgi:hypothetical protein